MKNKLQFYKILLVLLLIASTITIILIIKKYVEQNKYEKQSEEVLEVFSHTQEKIGDDGTSLVVCNGYQVIGTIKIPKIDLEYPILDKTTKESMLIAISRFWGRRYK